MRFNSTRENLFIMAGHMADDLCHGAIPAILAFMYQEGRLSSYAQVATLIMANTVINAIVQPLAGYISDQKPRPYLMAAGLAIAASGIMFTGITQSFEALFLLILVNGAGLAIFHPSAGRLANLFSKNLVGKGMSIFSVGGNIGFALGPVYFTAGYMLMGMSATLLMCLPALIMVSLFVLKNRFYQVVSQQAAAKLHRHQQDQLLQENYKAMGILIVLIFIRSAAWFALVSFLPLYFMHQMGLADHLAASINSAVCLAGAVATLLGGTFSDRLGYTRLVQLASLISVPFIVMFCLSEHLVVAVLLLLPFAMLFFAGMSPVVVLGQKFLCRHVGMATGITVGLGMSFGGLCAPLLGHLGDLYGLNATMWSAAALIALGTLISFLIPQVKASDKA